MFARAFTRKSSQENKTADYVSGKPELATKRTRTFGRDLTNANGNGDADTSKVIKPSDSSAPVISSDINIKMDDDVQMEDEERPYMSRPSDDIDVRDIENPLLCTEYVNEMYDIFSNLERDVALNPEYMSNQPFINEKMRAILCDWLVEVHLKYKMVPETLYLTVNILDRYLQLKQVRRSKLQLVGVAALSIAAKYEEIYPPELRDYVYITDKAYNKSEIVEMESEIANTLQYNLTVPTVHAFLCRFLKAAHADRTMVQLACYLAERSLQEYSMCAYLPSVVAATSVLIARKTLRRHPWSPTLVKYTKYDEPDLEECVAEMKKILTSTTSQQQAVQRKYTSQKFGGVASLTMEF